jgi:hypothetical protein
MSIIARTQTSAIDRVHSVHVRDHSPAPISRPTWTSRCACTHIAGVHSNRDRNNLEGPCLRCHCDLYTAGRA